MYQKLIELIRRYNPSRGRFYGTHHRDGGRLVLVLDAGGSQIEPLKNWLTEDRIRVTLDLDLESLVGLMLAYLSSWWG